MTQENTNGRALAGVPDPAGIVRRGDEVGFRGHVEAMGCFVSAHARCETAATMEVYGLPMCPAHGEEAAALAMEELVHDLENELLRPLNDSVRDLSPHIEDAIRRGMDGIPAHDHKPADAALLEAFPLVQQGRVCNGTLAFQRDPDAWAGYGTPFDMHQEARMLLHRLMRLAFEADADWLVQVLEGEREAAAEQAAYALALDREVFGESA